jgi:hypothetical protein
MLAVCPYCTQHHADLDRLLRCVGLKVLIFKCLLLTLVKNLISF